MAAPVPLFDNFLRGDPESTAGDFKPPDARYAAPSVIRKRPDLAWQPFDGGKGAGGGKLFLGLIDGTIKLDEEGRPYMAGGHAVGVADDRHMMTIAGSRSGKGRSCILPNMLHYRGSVLATDPKGELATLTAKRRKSMGQHVHVLDPFGVANVPADLRAGFNPVAAMRGGDKLIEDAALITDALVVSAGKDPHWDESAKTFINGVLLHLRTSPAYEGRRSLLTLQELIAKGAPEEKAPGGTSMKELELQMRENEAAEGTIQMAAADFFDRPENEGGSVLSSARRHLSFINLFRTDHGRRTLEQPGLELNALKARPTTIYLCLPARHIGTCNRWLRLFVNLTLQNMETFDSALPGGVPVLCALDEFAQLGHMQQIEAAAGQIAGFGVKLWPILQDLAQLKDLYQARWETFLGNAGVVQFFGNNDLTTLEWISKRLGKTSIEAVSRSDISTQTRKTSSGESWSMEVHDLLGIDEAARLFSRDDPQFRQLVLWGGQRPLVLQRAFYDQHELFKGLAASGAA